MTLEINSRKPREIKNAPVDIDNVSIAPGFRFADWIDIARRKLAQREISLLQQRAESCNDTIMLMINTFASNHAETFDIHSLNILQMETATLAIYENHIQHKIECATNGYMREVMIQLSRWNGYHPRPTSHKIINTFREYFQHSRSSFDQTKMKLFALHFVIPLTNAIEELAHKSAIDTFGTQSLPLQNIYKTYLSIWILQGIFEAQFKPSNTRLTWLVPATVYSKLPNQSYLNLQIQVGIQSTKHTEIRQCYLQSIRNQTIVLKKSLEVELSTCFKSDECDAFMSANATNAFAQRNTSMSGSAPDPDQWTRNHNNGQKGMNSDWCLGSTPPGFEMNDPYHMLWHSPTPPYFPFCESPSPLMQIDPMMSSDFDVNAFCI